MTGHDPAIGRADDRQERLVSTPPLLISKNDLSFIARQSLFQSGIDLEFAHSEAANPFAIRGLVKSGTFIVAETGESVIYGAGQVFDITRGGLHDEWIGPDGANVVIGRRFPVELTLEANADDPLLSD